MKRARDSSFSETQMPGLSIADLPSTIFVEILLKLPAKSIVMCKSVCKAWNGSISDPQFAKLHLARAKSCALIRGIGFHKFLRSLYFLESGDGLDSGYCGCRTRKQRCKNCRFNKEVKFKLKLPLRNPQVLHFVADNSDSEVMLCVKTTWKSNNLIRLKSSKDHCYEVTNSCNGFLCLVEPSSSVSVCICNPITGEFTHLPQACSHWNNGLWPSKFGFGFSPKHNQYKVVRMSTCWTCGLLATGWQPGHSVVVDVHTLGTDSWRTLDISGSDMPPMHYSSYLNGSLYWTFSDGQQMYCLASFDLDDEQFHTHSIPFGRQHFFPQLSVAVLEGRLFVCARCYTGSRVDIWLVNKRGVSLSWTQMFSIDLTGLDASYNKYQYELVCCLNDRAVVLFGGPWDEFIYYDQSEGFKSKHPKFRGIKSKFNVLVFTPSFVSLKEAAISGSNIEVLNVNSGCGKLKLLEETYPLLLGKARN